MKHGGNLRELANRVGAKPDDILDFSASINPLGPPAAVSTVLSRAVDLIVHYPDPAATEFREAIALRHGVPLTQVVAGNGSSELLTAIARAFPSRRWVLSDPCYSGYQRAAESLNAEVQRLARLPNSFYVDWHALNSACDQAAIVVLGHPNNPTGVPLDLDNLAELAGRHRETVFVVDESFTQFSTDRTSAASLKADNVITLRSMTKFYALPGLRLGYAIACKETTSRLTAVLPEWNVNAIAQQVGKHCVGDDEYAARTRKLIGEWRVQFAEMLSSLPALKVFPSHANFMLCRTDAGKLTAQSLAENLLQSERIAIRPCADFIGLDDRYFRLAVRTDEENSKLANALARAFGNRHNGRSKGFSSPSKRAPALMIQGVSSNAGKSIIAAAFCRILARDGIRVAPFKSQNMSLNSFVTRDGHEISRAQVVQAQAAGLEPDVRMNPVLLKPNSQTGSQVIVNGHPVGNMRVKEFYRFKPQAFEHAQRAYDSLASDFDLIILEGAGSPGEVNLKRHDIVNMNMARHAGASVLLVGDIDRGGVFASFVGTMAVLEAWERRLVAGYIVNRFRGDASLLNDAYTYMLRHTGKPVLGTVPNIDDLAIPDEDSVTFKQEISHTVAGGDQLDIALIDLPHIANVTDCDPLKLEPNVSLRTVRDPESLGYPDAVILPGSRNTLHDLQYLKRKGFEPAFESVAKNTKTEMIGICGGFQMLGRMISDPSGIESDGDRQLSGFGLLDVTTEMAPQKTLRQIDTEHKPSSQRVTGYEIHHGATVVGDVSLMLENDGEPLAVCNATGHVWGTYLHGVFEQDGFRHWFLDRLRRRKGLPQVVGQGVSYDLEAAYDALADVVAAHVDLKTIYGLLGL
ncbi:MAG: cobyric acid synthase [Pirellulales bacterium]|nr:cobyric acid synthase [Pirellulales bacterium]